MADVATGSPGAKAGLKTGDLVTSIDGVAIDDPTGLNYRLATKGIGATAKLGILRKGKAYVASLALEAAPETVPRDEIGAQPVRRRSPAPRCSTSRRRWPKSSAYRGQPQGVIVGAVEAGRSPRMPA